MYCPVCRVEFQQGYGRCSACDVDLVEVLPLDPEPSYAETVTVFEGDPNSVAVARTTVESVGIDSWTTDEGLHGLFPNLGASGIAVRAEDEKRALKALQVTMDSEAAPTAGASLSNHSPSLPITGSGLVPEARGKEFSNSRKPHHATPEKTHHVKDHHRSGKRV